MRVRLKLSSGRTSLSVSALVNTGFEADEPELIVPEKVSEMLGLRSSAIARFRMVGGSETMGARAEGTVAIELLLEDREPARAEVYVTTLPGEDEVIISDRLASQLGIVILDPHKGDWCLVDEVGSKRRSSAKPNYW